MGAGTSGKGTTSVVPNRAPLEQFRARYGDRSITKWDIFHYIYAVLHHPEYRQRYAANLRRELPRIPFVSASPHRVGTGIPARPAEQSSASTSTLSSRAQQNRSLANDSAESRDPVSAGSQQGRREEFSQRTLPGAVRGKNASQDPRKMRANTGSFDSVNGPASESIPSAQDDRPEVPPSSACGRTSSG